MFIVLINANAGWVRKRSLATLMDACEHILGNNGRVFVSREPEDIRIILAALEAADITALVPVGGDGTLSVVLTAALVRWGEAGLPAVLPLQGGTMNMVALSARQRRRELPLMTLERIVGDWRAGRELTSTWRPLLRSDTGHAGFVAGFGVPTRFLQHYYSKGGGLLQAMNTLLQYSGSTLVRGRRAQALFSTTPTTLSIDDASATSQPLSLLLAMTIDTLPLGFRVGDASATEGMTLLSGRPNPVRLLGSLPLIYRGRLPAATGLQRQPCKSIRLEFSQPQSWQLDGDILPPVKHLLLECSVHVRLLV